MSRLLFLLIFSVTANLQAKENGFVGVWSTTYGKMRIIDNKNNQLVGVYSFDGESSIEGKLEKDKFIFKYKEKNISGEGWFLLKNNGLEFEGEWLQQGQKEWKKWVGKKLNPLPDKMWLYVIEANWEDSIEEREYAFGDMLKAFFDRTNDVLVRRRSFTDGNSLRRWLKEATYLPEPVVVVIASHGENEGLKVDGQIISSQYIAEGLQYAGNVKAVHFSSCLVMKGSFGKEVHKKLTQAGLKLAVSGYANSFDWAASALFEMTYFDLILERGMNPFEASKTALKMFPVAGQNQISGVPIKPGMFQILYN